MKALKITLTHGRIWTVETSSGVRAQSSTLQGALDQLVIKPPPADMHPYNFYGLAEVFDSIRDSGGDGNIGHGVKSA